MHIKAVILTLLVVIIWSSNFIFIKLGVNEISPLMLLTLRFLLAGLIFLPFMKWPGMKKALAISSIGILMGLLHQGFLYAGLTTLPAGMMSILLQSQVIMVTIIGWLFLKESIGWRTWTGIALGIIGIIMLVGGIDLTSSLTGIVYGLLSAFFIAITYIVMKRLDTVNGATYITLIHLPSAPLIFSASIALEGTDWISNMNALNWDIISIVIVYQAIVLSISHIIWQKLLVQYPVTEIVPWTLLLPLFAVGIAVPILGEPITTSIIVGGMLTVLGVGIITFRKLKKKTV